MKVIIVKEIKEKDGKLPKRLVPFFFVCYFLFGMDFGFAAHLDENHRTSYRRLSLTVSLIMIVSISIPVLQMYHVIWVWFTIWEYISHFLILKLTAYKPCDFIIDMQAPNDEVTKLSIAVTAYTLLMILLKLILCILRCLYSQYEYCHFSNLYVYIFYNWPCYSVDFISVVLIITFYYISFKLENLKRGIVMEEINVKEFLAQYMKMADCYDKIEPFLSRVVMNGLIFGVPKLMATLWYTLLVLKQNELNWATCACQVLFSFHTTLQLCLPALIAEKINFQIDAVKVILSEKIATGTDDHQTGQASRVLQYLQQRRLQHEIFRVIPLDIRLPVALFGLCSTYFIVIIQFTHLYD